jgi:hypothetical protein
MWTEPFRYYEEEIRASQRKILRLFSTYLKKEWMDLVKIDWNNGILSSPRIHQLKFSLPIQRNWCESRVTLNCAATAHTGTLWLRFACSFPRMLARSHFSTRMSCDRKTRSRFSVILLDPKPNSRLEPKLHCALHPTQCSQQNSLLPHLHISDSHSVNYEKYNIMACDAV